jgi:hypothetical protein
VVEALFWKGLFLKLNLFLGELQVRFEVLLDELDLKFFLLLKKLLWYLLCMVYPIYLDWEEVVVLLVDLRFQRVIVVFLVFLRLLSESVIEFVGEVVKFLFDTQCGVLAFFLLLVFLFFL